MAKTVAYPNELGIPSHWVSLVKNLHEASEAIIVKVDTTLSEKCRIRERCSTKLHSFSSDVLCLHEVAMRHVLEDWINGVKIGGKRFSNSPYADDTLLIENSPEELLKFLEKLEWVSLEYGLQINANKIKVIISGADNENRRQ